MARQPPLRHALPTRRLDAEQVTELFLKGTDLEVKHVELLGSRPSVEWIVPPFFRVKGR